MKIVFLSTILLASISISPSMAIAADLDFDAEKNIEEVLRVVDESYVYPQTAQVMRQFVSKKMSLGSYREVRSQKALIRKLQSDLREASQDSHISLHLAEGRPDRKTHVLPATKPHQEFEIGVVSEETDDDKIGYLRFNKFSGNAKTKERLVAAINELTAANSLIIDLRDNTGGDPDLAAFLSSFLLPENTHLWSILDRDGNAILETNSVSQDLTYQGNVCLLTSQRTGSAAEAFAYTLKHLGRACIIGQATGGAAHLVQMERVNDEIDIRIPVARPYNSITKSNWEGIGVIPTIEVEASLAKSVAIKHLKNKNN